MTSDTYIRPTGIMSAPELSGEDSFFGGLPLTGDGSQYYTAVELFERAASGQVTRRILGLGELWETDLGIDGGRISAVLERISDPRSRMSGLGFDRPIIMGVLNVTPDSFSDGGKFMDTGLAVDHALRLEDEGADIIDVGGESTRPNAEIVSIEDEFRRVIPVIEALAGRTDARISIDTRNAEVMREAADAGADIINDVSALSHDPESMNVAALSGLPIILMHAQGTPKTMQDKPDYENVLLDVFDYLEERIEVCIAAGIERSRLVVDPGIGFGKTVGHNLELISGISLFHGLGVPILLGASRKRFIGTVNQEPDAEKRMPGSLAVAQCGVAQGVQIVRVHDVKETRQALEMWQAINHGAVNNEA